MDGTSGARGGGGAAWNRDELDPSRREYRERINRVLDYVDAHLADELVLATLARVAGFSDWHFHRIFASLVGENLHAYVRRRRLTAAAHRLLFDPGRTVTAVALDCGFASASDLSRAFRALYGSSPRQFRRRKGRLPVRPQGEGGREREPRVLDQASRQAHEERITIQQLPDLHVAYIRSFGLSPERKSPAVERAFRRLHAWGASAGYLGADTRFLGLTRDNPEVQPLERCRYDACITVPPEAHGSGDISVGMIATAGAYAVYAFGDIVEGFAALFFEAADYLYGMWLAERGLHPEDKPILELFGASARPRGVSLDLYVPIRSA